VVADLADLADLAAVGPVDRVVAVRADPAAVDRALDAVKVIAHADAAVTAAVAIATGAISSRT
jgi:hypothetical protein